MTHSSSVLSDTTTVSQTAKPLDDVQGYADTRGIALKIAGVKNVQLPMRLLQKDGGVQTVNTTASMGVHLPASDKGTHMSRFIIQLAEWSENRVMTLNFRGLLNETCELLGSSAASLDLAFMYFLDKKAPVTDYSAPMGFQCSIETCLEKSTQSPAQDYQMVLGVTVPIATLCPCSKEISDYGAHNQRAEIRAKLRLDKDHTVSENPHAPEPEMVWFEDIIAGLEQCASCPVYPVLKRLDEKYVTERQYDNPKFVEDVVRDATLLLRNYPGIAGFQLEVEALESIHGHNAWAVHDENF